jgi:hypothetical protein
MRPYSNPCDWAALEAAGLDQHGSREGKDQRTIRAGTLPKYCTVAPTMPGRTTAFGMSFAATNGYSGRKFCRHQQLAYDRNPRSRCKPFAQK